MRARLTTAPKHIVQVYRNVRFYTRDQQSASSRAQMLTWPAVLVTRTGYIEADRVTLNPSAQEQQPTLERSDILWMRYSHPDNHATHYRAGDNNQYYGFFSSSQPWHHHYEIFKFQPSEEGFELSLAYGRNAFLIGQPRRDDFHLGTLRRDAPLRVQLNGRGDFSMTSRRQRTYRLFDYILVYRGRYASFEFAAWNHVEKAQAVPLESAKVINLQKNLY